MTVGGTSWSLGHRPALDGLRGLAVLLVVVSHVRSPWIGYAAGNVGVTMFFTLSGFLIGTLLLQELETTSRLDFRRFYVKRARRLLPALFAVVVVAVAVTAATGIAFVSAPEIVGVLTYSTNIIELVMPIPPNGMLHHTWSLVIEEQFYLAWPVLTLALWRRRDAMLGITGVGCVLVMVQRLRLFGEVDLLRLSFSIDTRVDGILIGCGVAVLLRSGLPARVQGAGLGLVVIGVLALAPNPVTLLCLTCVGIATAVVIVAVLTGDAPRWLAWGPLAGIGRVSYGLYLWHHLVLIWSDRALGFRGDWVATALVVLPSSALLTSLSWKYLEKPWLRHRASAGAAADPAPRPAGTSAEAIA